MCGILGFSGKGYVREIVSRGLQSLEYRGYDSCGYGFLSGDRMKISKRTGKGKITELFSDLPEYTGKRVYIISHTRWATHGKVSVDNAHPHTDCRKEIAVVHNGIIENYARLKDILKQKGHNFISDTDTEVIPHLIEENEKHLNFREAVLKSLNELEGSFAILVLRKNNPEIIGARKGSPLLAGIKGKNFIISSDLNSVTEYTDEIIFFEDGEMFTVNEGIDVVDFATGKNIAKKVSMVNTDSRETGKGAFESYMQKEIFEQPEVLDRTFYSLYSELNYYQDLIDFLPRRIIIVGCGSSWHAGLIGEYIMEDFLRLPVEVEYASEFRYRNPVFLPGDLVISISQSGETADTMGAVKIAKNKTKTLSICNVYNSSIARESDYVLYTKAGPEIGVASTKAFTAQLAVLYFLNFMLGCKMGMVDKTFFSRKAEGFKKIPGVVRRILASLQEIEEISGNLQSSSDMLFLGRGLHFPVALEGALKMKEISYIHAEGYPAAEMKHGPIALIDKNMPVVFVAVRDNLSVKILSNMAEIKSRGGYIITVTDAPNNEILKVSDRIVRIPEIEDEYLKPILTVIPLQILACLTAVKRGCDVDKPRNLAKSVTVE